uniref:dehydrogenase/reductase SDR family member 7B isoform X2 n=1 Tax=Myxine glutinosa TaxID=7769 RepID=UPI00358F2B5A
MNEEKAPSSAREKKKQNLRFWTMIRTKATEAQSPSVLQVLVAGGFGLWILFWLVRRLRTRSYCRDKVVVVTGASSGLGEECARVFHAAGARLVICGRNRQKLEELRDSLANPAEDNDKARVPCVVTFDLGESEAVEEAARTVLKCYSRVDVLLNCAGLSARGDVQDTTLAVHRRLMDVNYFGTMALTKALLPSMVNRGSGHVVVISSVQGRIAIPFRSAYSASKHALQAFCDCLRAEVAEHGIDVTVISPGYIRTNLSINAVSADGSPYGRLDATTAEGQEPEAVAKEVYQAVVNRKKDVVLAGPVPKAAICLRALAPSIYFFVMARRARRERQRRAVEQ